MSAIEGPVLCERLGLCLWSGKTFISEFFHLSQKMATVPAFEEQFIARLSRQEFALIQMKTRKLSGRLKELIESNYSVAWRNSIYGEFLVPRDKPIASGE